MKEGDLVNIYTDFKFEEKFEGVARVIKKIDVGHSFIIVDEKLYTQLEDRALSKDGSHLPLTKTQESNNKKYARLILYFEGTSKKEVNKEFVILGKKIKSLLSSKLESIDKINHVLDDYRNTWRNTTDTRKLFFKEFNNETIIRFFQQRYMKNWSPSIWREEKWLVEFIPDQYCIERKVCLFNSSFRTIRKMRKLICICPNEDAQNCEIHHYTTDESGISNADKKEKREENSIEFEEFYDEELKDEYEF